MIRTYALFVFRVSFSGVVLSPHGGLFWFGGVCVCVFLVAVFLFSFCFCCSADRFMIRRTPRSFVRNGTLLRLYAETCKGIKRNSVFVFETHENVTRKSRECRRCRRSRRPRRC